jgi:hypothetical protein
LGRSTTYVLSTEVWQSWLRRVFEPNIQQKLTAIDGDIIFFQFSSDSHTPSEERKGIEEVEGVEGAGKDGNTRSYCF